MLKIGDASNAAFSGQGVTTESRAGFSTRKTALDLSRVLMPQHVCIH